jgi:hypothetical protein
LGGYIKCYSISDRKTCGGLVAMQNQISMFEQEYGSYDMAENKEKWERSFRDFRIGWAAAIMWMEELKKENNPSGLHGEKDE